MELTCLKGVDTKHGNLYTVDLNNKPSATPNTDIKEKLEQVLYLLGKFCASDELYHELTMICADEWLKANKLSLKIKKIKLCNLSSRQKNMPFIPRIRILDSVTNTYANLEMKDYVKHLGLMMDSNLSWKYNIESTYHKISKIRHYVTHRVLLSVYNSLIVPYLTYGIYAWGNCAVAFQRKIAILQSKETMR